jgi:hypothetical protein
MDFSALQPAAESFLLEKESQEDKTKAANKYLGRVSCLFRLRFWSEMGEIEAKIVSSLRIEEEQSKSKAKSKWNEAKRRETQVKQKQNKAETGSQTTAQCQQQLEC